MPRRSGLRDVGRSFVYIFPVWVSCRVCKRESQWGDLIRRQRCILEMEAVKPVVDGVRLAENMPPKVFRFVDQPWTSKYFYCAHKHIELHENHFVAVKASVRRNKRVKTRE